MSRAGIEADALLAASFEVEEAQEYRAVTQSLNVPLQAEIDTMDRDQLIVEYTPLVRRIVYHFAIKLPANVQVDDLMQTGLIGLLDAINRYEGSYGCKFESYAAQRIRGSILDALRQADWLPRSMRKKTRQIETARQMLEQRLGCSPSEQELADALNMPLEAYQTALQEAYEGQLLYYEDYQENDEDHFLDHLCSSNKHNDPLDQLLAKNLRELLIDAIKILPAREKLLMGMYYEQEMNLREIGAVLGVSESRACQLHTQAIARLQTRLKSCLGIPALSKIHDNSDYRDENLNLNCAREVLRELTTPTPMPQPV